MKIIRSKDLSFVPASHEDPLNPGVLKKVLFNCKDIPAGKIQMINWALLAAGKQFKLHSHKDMSEIFIIISGEAVLRIDEKESTLLKGDAVFIPPQSMHQMRNVSHEDCLFLTLGIVAESELTPTSKIR